MTDIRLNIRLTEDERETIKVKSKEYGFSTVTAYVKYVALNATVVATVPKPSKEDKK